MARSTTITINSNHVQISDEQIFLATRDQTPESPRTYVTLVNNVPWPPKQLLRLATGSEETTDFNTHTALKALNELGFTTYERAVYDARGAVVPHQSRKRS